MFESLVQKLLESYLGEWITDYKQLHLSVWSGIVEMKNLKVKSELFDHLKLPFRVHDGRIGEIQIKIPWRSLRSEPVQITVDRVYLLVTPVDQSSSGVASFDDINEAQLQRKRFFKQSKLDAAELIRQEKIRSESQSAVSSKRREEQSFSDALLQVMLENTQITIRDVHVRFEAPPTSDDPSGYAFGLTLHEARVRTVDANAAPAFVNSTDGNAAIFLHRRWELDAFACYWESRPCSFVHLAPGARLQAFAAWIRPAVNASSPSSTVVQESFAFNPNDVSQVATNANSAPSTRASTPLLPISSQSYPSLSHFLVSPLSASALHIQYRPLDTKAPRHSIQINVASARTSTGNDELSFDLDLEQASGMIRFVRWLSMHEQWVKWEAYRPMEPPQASLDALNRQATSSKALPETMVARSRSSVVGTDSALSWALGSNIAQTASTPLKPLSSSFASPPSSARAWWHYVMHILRVGIRERKRPDPWRELLRRVLNRNKYIDTFKRMEIKASKSQLRERYADFTATDIKLLQQLEDDLEFEDIIYFRSIAHEEIRLEEVTLAALASTQKPTSKSKSVASPISKRGERQRPLLAPGHRDLLFETMDYNASLKMFPRDYVDISFRAMIPKISAFVYFSPYSQSNSHIYPCTNLSLSSSFMSLDSWLASFNVFELNRRPAFNTLVDTLTFGLKIRSDSFVVETSVNSFFIHDKMTDPLSSTRSTCIIQPRPLLKWRSRPENSALEQLSSLELLTESCKPEADSIIWDLCDAEPWLSLSLDVCPPSNPLVSKYLQGRIAPTQINFHNSTLDLIPELVSPMISAFSEWRLHSEHVDRRESWLAEALGRLSASSLMQSSLPAGVNVTLHAPLLMIPLHINFRAAEMEHENAALVEPLLTVESGAIYIESGPSKHKSAESSAPHGLSPAWTSTFHAFSFNVSENIAAWDQWNHAKAKVFVSLLRAIELRVPVEDNEQSIENLKFDLLPEAFNTWPGCSDVTPAFTSFNWNLISASRSMRAESKSTESNPKRSLSFQSQLVFLNSPVAMRNISSSSFPSFTDNQNGTLHSQLKPLSIREHRMLWNHLARLDSEIFIRMGIIQPASVTLEITHPPDQVARTPLAADSSSTQNPLDDFSEEATSIETRSIYNVKMASTLRLTLSQYSYHLLRAVWHFLNGIMVDSLSKWNFPSAPRTKTTFVTAKTSWQFFISSMIVTFVRCSMNDRSDRVNFIQPSRISKHQSFAQLNIVHAIGSFKSVSKLDEFNEVISHSSSARFSMKSMSLIDLLTATKVEHIFKMESENTACQLLYTPETPISIQNDGLSTPASSACLSVHFFVPFDINWHPSLVASFSLFFCEPMILPDLAALLQSLPCSCSQDSVGSNCWHSLTSSQIQSALLPNSEHIDTMLSHFPRMILHQLLLDLDQWKQILTSDLSASLPEIRSPISSTSTPVVFSVFIPSGSIRLYHSSRPILQSESLHDQISSDYVGNAPVCCIQLQNAAVHSTFKADSSMAIEGTISDLSITDIRSSGQEYIIFKASSIDESVGTTTFVSQEDFDWNDYLRSTQESAVSFLYTSPSTFQFGDRGELLFERPRSQLIVELNRAQLTYVDAQFNSILDCILTDFLESYDSGPLWVRSILVPRTLGFLLSPPPQRSAVRCNACQLILPVSNLNRTRGVCLTVPSCNVYQDMISQSHSFSQKLRSNSVKILHDDMFSVFDSKCALHELRLPPIPISEHQDLFASTDIFTAWLTDSNMTSEHEMCGIPVYLSRVVSVHGDFIASQYHSALDFSSKDMFDFVQIQLFISTLLSETTTPAQFLCNNTTLEPSVVETFTGTTVEPNVNGFPTLKFVSKRASKPMQVHIDCQVPELIQLSTDTVRTLFQVLRLNLKRMASVYSCDVPDVKVKPPVLVVGIPSEQAWPPVAFGHVPLFSCDESVSYSFANKQFGQVQDFDVDAFESTLTRPMEAWFKLNAFHINMLVSPSDALALNAQNGATMCAPLHVLNEHIVSSGIKVGYELLGERISVFYSETASQSIMEFDVSTPRLYSKYDMTTSAFTFSQLDLSPADVMSVLGPETVPLVVSNEEANSNSQLRASFLEKSGRPDETKLELGSDSGYFFVGSEWQGILLSRVDLLASPDQWLTLQDLWDRISNAPFDCQLVPQNASSRSLRKSRLLFSYKHVNIFSIFDWATWLKHMHCIRVPISGTLTFDQHENPKGQKLESLSPKQFDLAQLSLESSDELNVFAFPGYENEITVCDRSWTVRIETSFSLQILECSGKTLCSSSLASSYYEFFLPLANVLSPRTIIPESSFIFDFSDRRQMVTSENRYEWTQDICITITKLDVNISFRDLHFLNKCFVSDESSTQKLSTISSKWMPWICQRPQRCIIFMFDQVQLLFNDDSFALGQSLTSNSMAALPLFSCAMSEWSVKLTQTSIDPVARSVVWDLFESLSIEKSTIESSRVGARSTTKLPSSNLRKMTTEVAIGQLQLGSFEESLALKSKMMLSCHYFNPYVSSWEPICEPWAFRFNASACREKTQFTFQSQEKSKNATNLGTRFACVRKQADSQRLSDSILNNYALSTLNYETRWISLKAFLTSPDAMNLNISEAMIYSGLSFLSRWRAFGSFSQEDNPDASVSEIAATSSVQLKEYTCFNLSGVPVALTPHSHRPEYLDDDADNFSGQDPSSMLSLSPNSLSSLPAALREALPPNTPDSVVAFQLSTEAELSASIDTSSTSWLALTSVHSLDVHVSIDVSSLPSFVRHSESSSFAPTSEVLTVKNVPIQRPGSFALKLHQRSDRVTASHHSATLLLDIVAHGSNRVLMLHSGVALQNKLSMPVLIRVAVEDEKSANGARPRIYLPDGLAPAEQTSSASTDEEMSWDAAVDQGTKPAIGSMYLPLWAVRDSTLISWSLDGGSSWSDEISMRILLSEGGAYLRCGSMSFSAIVHCVQLPDAASIQVDKTVTDDSAHAVSRDMSQSVSPTRANCLYTIILQPPIRLVNSLPIPLNFRMWLLPPDFGSNSKSAASLSASLLEAANWSLFGPTAQKTPALVRQLESLRRSGAPPLCQGTIAASSAVAIYQHINLYSAVISLSAGGTWCAPHPLWDYSNNEDEEFELMPLQLIDRSEQGLTIATNVRSAPFSSLMNSATANKASLSSLWWRASFSVSSWIVDLTGLSGMDIRDASTASEQSEFSDLSSLPKFGLAASNQIVSRAVNYLASDESDSLRKIFELRDLISDSQHRQKHLLDTDMNSWPVTLCSATNLIFKLPESQMCSHIMPADVDGSHELFSLTDNLGRVAEIGMSSYRIPHSALFNIIASDEIEAPSFNSSGNVVRHSDRSSSSLLVPRPRIIVLTPALIVVNRCASTSSFTLRLKQFSTSDDCEVRLPPGQVASWNWPRADLMHLLCLCCVSPEGGWQSEWSRPISVQLGGEKILKVRCTGSDITPFFRYLAFNVEQHDALTVLTLSDYQLHDRLLSHRIENHTSDVQLWVSPARVPTPRRRRVSTDSSVGLSHALASVDGGMSFALDTDMEEVDVHNAVSFSSSTADVPSSKSRSYNLDRVSVRRLPSAVKSKTNKDPFKRLNSTNSRAICIQPGDFVPYLPEINEDFDVDGNPVQTHDAFTSSDEEHENHSEIDSTWVRVHISLPSPVAMNSPTTPEKHSKSKSDSPNEICRVSKRLNLNVTHQHFTICTCNSRVQFISIPMSQNLSAFDSITDSACPRCSLRISIVSEGSIQVVSLTNLHSRYGSLDTNHNSGSNYISVFDREALSSHTAGRFYLPLPKGVGSGFATVILFDNDHDPSNIFNQCRVYAHGINSGTLFPELNFHFHVSSIGVSLIADCVGAAVGSGRTVTSELQSSLTPSVSVATSSRLELAYIQCSIVSLSAEATQAELFSVSVNVDNLQVDNQVTQAVCPVLVWIESSMSSNDAEATAELASQNPEETEDEDDALPSIGRVLPAIAWRVEMALPDDVRHSLATMTSSKASARSARMLSPHIHVSSISLAIQEVVLQVDDCFLLQMARAVARVEHSRHHYQSLLTSLGLPLNMPSSKSLSNYRAERRLQIDTMLIYPIQLRASYICSGLGSTSTASKKSPAPSTSQSQPNSGVVSAAAHALALARRSTANMFQNQAASALAVDYVQVAHRLMQEHLTSRRTSNQSSSPSAFDDDRVSSNASSTPTTRASSPSFASPTQRSVLRRRRARQRAALQAAVAGELSALLLSSTAGGGDLSTHVTHAIELVISTNPYGIIGAGEVDDDSLRQQQQFDEFGQLPVHLLRASIDPVVLQCTALGARYLTVRPMHLLALSGVHFRSQLRAQALKILGSFRVLGAPLALVSSLAKGLHDLVSHPLSGAASSRYLLLAPAGLLAGAVAGAGSLVRHSMAGAMQSASNVLSGLATASAWLSADAAFAAAQNRFFLRARSAGHGIAQGSHQLSASLFDAVSGLVTIPLDFARRDGLRGLLDGMARAALGALFKPVTGVLGFAAKTAEGVSQSAANSLSPSTRKRLPRLLYGPDRILRPYSDSEALAAFLLAQLDDGAHAGDSLVALVEFRKQEMQLLLTTRSIICVRVTDQRTLWCIHWAAVRRIEFSGRWQVVIYHTEKPRLLDAQALSNTTAAPTYAWQRIAFRQRDTALNCMYLVQSAWLRVHVGPQQTTKQALPADNSQ